MVPMRILTTLSVNMSGDDLKSAEKRAADAAMEKENMRVAMTATEQKAISTTYVAPKRNRNHLTRCTMREQKTSYHILASEASGVRYGVFLAFDRFLSINSQNLTDIPKQHAMWQVQDLQGRIHTGSDSRR